MSSKGAPRRHAVESRPSDPVEISRQLLSGEEEERRRISRELHDETGQSLMVLRFHLEMLAAEAKNPPQQMKVQEALDVLDRAIEGLRRIIARLSPRVLEELGLLAAIRRQAQQVGNRTRIKARLDVPETIPTVAHDIEVALYRSVQESLQNIAKHSQASTFSIKLQTTAERILLEISDDGVGFFTSSPQERGFGLTGMRERAVALGGSMSIHSRRGKGTHIRISLPYIPGSPSKRVAEGSARPARRAPTARAS